MTDRSVTIPRCVDCSAAISPFATGCRRCAAQMRQRRGDPTIRSDREAIAASDGSAAATSTDAD